MEELKPNVVVIHPRPAGDDEVLQAAEASDVAAALASKGYAAETACVDRSNVLELAADLGRRRDTTAVFNLCGAIDGEPRHSSLVAGLLELQGVRYAGNGPATLGSCADKRITKALLFAAGIPTPGARVFRTPPKVDGVRDMAFPLVVKPLREDASLGVTARSYVTTPEELCERVEEALQTYRQPVLGEVYMNGREFSLSVTGAGRTATALPASEVAFEGYGDDEPRLVTREARRAAGAGGDRQVRVRCPADVGEHLRVSLATAALAAYRALECRDYARIDLRLNHRGTPNVLEVNPNPGLGRGSRLARTIEASGDLYEDFLERLVQGAWAR